MECTLCRLVAKELPMHKVYEDKNVLAVLDIAPFTEGHTIIIPKTHRENINDITETEIASVSIAAKKLAAVYKAALKSDGFNLLHATGEVAGQSEFHFHMHLIPRYKTDGLDFWLHGKRPPIDNKKVYEKIMGSEKGK